jgi:hypothetical protein
VSLSPLPAPSPKDPTKFIFFYMQSDQPAPDVNPSLPPAPSPRDPTQFIFLYAIWPACSSCDSLSSTSSFSQGSYTVYDFYVIWPACSSCDSLTSCGDQLLSSLHNFKYHLHECSNPGMASTAGGVCREEKPSAYKGLVGLRPSPVAHGISYGVLNCESPLVVVVQLLIRA